MKAPQEDAPPRSTLDPGPRGERLVDGYDLVVFDLDGVIYLIDKPIAGAVEAVGELHRAGVRLAYATNNASRRSGEVADLLVGLGVPADAGEVITSAGASAAALAQRLPPGSKVLVVGAEALSAEVRDAGLSPVSRAEDRPDAVVQGYGPQVCWADLAEAAVAIRGGAKWVATNTDRTLPSPRGPLPGNGSLVAALRTALGREPDLVVGKPEPELFATAARRVGATRPIVVGDRLDTDIEGAVRAGMDSLLVLTGVSGPAELLAAPPEQRPTYVAPNLAGLFGVASAAKLPPDEVEGWRLESHGGTRLAGDGSANDALRLLCGLAWSGGDAVKVTPDSPAARDALHVLGLA